MKLEYDDIGNIEGFYCSGCGQFHNDLPLDFGFDKPDLYFDIPQAERDVRCQFTEDLGIIDSQHHFIRGRLEIPVLDGPGPLTWGVWTSLSEKNFNRTVELWNNPARINEPPYFGWLCSRLPGYPAPVEIKTHVRTQPVGKRPLVELEPTSYPLALEQRQGITMERLLEIIGRCIHGK